MQNTGTTDLLVGIVLAIIAGTLLPFVTAQATAAIQSRRDRDARIRELFEACNRLAAQHVYQRPSWSPAGAVDEAVNEENKKARHELENSRIVAQEALFSWMGPADRVVRDAAGFFGRGSQSIEEQQLMTMWVSGRRLTARRMARKMLAKRKAIMASTPPTGTPPTPE